MTKFVTVYILCSFIFGSTFFFFFLMEVLIKNAISAAKHKNGTEWRWQESQPIIPQIMVIIKILCWYLESHADACAASYTNIDCNWPNQYQISCRTKPFLFPFLFVYFNLLRQNWFVAVKLYMLWYAMSSNVWQPTSSIFVINLWLTNGISK